MYKKTIISLALATLLTGCGSGDDSAPSNQDGSVALSGAEGAPSVGETLMATVTDPDGINENSVIYAWYANGVLIPGATDSSYVVTQADVGKTLYVIVGYVGGNGVRESKTSTTTAAVPSSVSVQATFIHGLVNGGSCQVFSVTSAGAKGASLAAATTASGAVDFGDIEYTGTGLIECTGGTYVDEASGSTLTAPTTRAVVDMSTSGQFVVSPLTEMAAQLAEASAGGFNEALTTYNSLVATEMGAVHNGVTLDITKVVPTNLQTTAALNDAAGKYATVLALVSQMDEDSADNAATIIADLATDLEDGTLSPTSIQAVAAAQTGLATSAVALNLNQDALDDVSEAIGATNTEGSVAVEGSPSVGSTLSAVVTDVNGVGTVTYQWRSDLAVIDGATAATYMVAQAELGTQLSVSVSYTDGAGFAEQFTSALTETVTGEAVNIEGSLGAIVGTLVVGSELSVPAPTDANGVGGSVIYQWQADGEDIADANAPEFVLTSDQIGKTVSVNATYTDNDDFAEDLTSTATDIAFSAIVNNKTELATALTDVTVAVPGGIIGINGGATDYLNVGEIKPAVGVTLKQTVDSSAVITGLLCLEVGDDVVIDGLEFNALDYVTGASCDSNGDSFVYLSGDNSTLRNNKFLGEAVAVTKTNYVTVKGYQALIERNYFTGKNRNLEGAYISTFANSSDLDQESHTIQYNHFTDVGNEDASLNSSAMALQIGRTTGTGAQDPGYTTVQYNLFEATRTNQRVIRVQSGENTFNGNTFDKTDGVIGLEDGFHNTVSNNIFAGANASGDGAIAFAPLGHVITGNYINNLATTSSDKKAGLVLYSSSLTGDGNAAIIAAKTAAELKVSVANNTIVNAKQAILLAASNCSTLPALLDFDNNLIANQSSENSINANSNGASRAAIRDSYFPTCSFNASSTFDGNHFYSSMLSDTGNFLFSNYGGAGNIAGAEDGAALTTPDENLLVEGTGADVGIGADIDGLTFITADMVGPNSTWTVQP